jgi:hypothetical protein
MDHLCPSGGGQSANLLGFLAEIYRPRSQFQVKIDRLPFQFAYFELHAMSVKHFQGGCRGILGGGISTVSGLLPGPFRMPSKPIILDTCRSRAFKKL